MTSHFQEIALDESLPVTVLFEQFGAQPWRDYGCHLCSDAVGTHHPQKPQIDQTSVSVPQLGL
jgi:hypothetical protein